PAARPRRSGPCSTSRPPIESPMKFVLFESPASGIHPGILTERGVVDIGALVPAASTAQLSMQWIIDNYDTAKPTFERAARDNAPVPAEAARLIAPLPRPGKILNCVGNYWEHAQRDPKPLKMFMKNPDAVTGPGGTIELPDFTEPWAFMHEAELAVVIKGPAKKVSRENWRDAV